MRRSLVQGHAARYREVATVLAEEGLGAVAVALSLPGAMRGHGDPDKTTPERVRRTLERLGPTAVKVGQMLSTRPDLLPEEYRTELRRLQDKVEPIPYEDVARVIEEELGASPNVIFARFVREPIASASIGQVHAASLSDGSEVAVKVQRPDIRAQVETDLDILRMQARRAEELGLALGAVDAVEVAEEFGSAVQRELDYLTEAANIERFGAAFAGDERIAVPGVHHAYTTRRVLTMDRLEGIPLNRLELVDEAGLDRAMLARRGVQAYLEMIFDIGAFHADPHPGNLFALPDGRVGFTDFGRVGEVGAGMHDAAVDILQGIVDQDADLATDALIEISREPGAIDAERLGREVSALIGKYSGRTLGQIRMGEMVEDLLDLVRVHKLCMPSDFVLMLATMAVLEGVGREIDPDFDFLEVARPYADRIMHEQLRPDNLARALLHTGRRLMRTVARLPSSVDRALRRVAEGEFRIAVRPEGYERLLMRGEELVDRLAFTVLIAAFVIGFSTLLTVQWLPGWAQVAATIGMFGAVAVAMWTFVSLFLARWRGRH